MKFLNQTNVINYKGKEYEVFVNTSILEKMNWSWESLIFPCSGSVFAYVLDLSTNDITNLEVVGEVKVFKDNEELDLDEVSQLALNGEIHNGNYFIGNSNWFSTTYGNKDANSFSFTIIEDDVFEAEPKSVDELIDILLETHLHFFSNK